MFHLLKTHGRDATEEVPGAFVAVQHAAQPAGVLKGGLSFQGPKSHAPFMNLLLEKIQQEGDLQVESGNDAGHVLTQDIEAFRT